MDEKLLPPTLKGREYELRALGLREFAGLQRDSDPLDPYSLAYLARLTVVDFQQIEGLNPAVRQHLLGAGSAEWSGGATRPLADGWRLVVLNPQHGRARNKATLMEEICHVFLGHEPNRLNIVVCRTRGGLATRDYSERDEEAAYAVGAAALAPFGAVKRFVRRGFTASAIARHFGVSRSLVEYRIKVSRLWPEYTRRQKPEKSAQL